MKLSFVIDKRKRKDGKHNLKARLAHQSKQFYHKLPINIKKNEWNEKNQRLRGVTDNVRETNKYLDKLQHDASELIMQNTSADDFFLKLFNRKPRAKTIEEFLPIYLEKFNNAMSRKSRKSKITQFALYAPNTELNKIDYTWCANAVTYFRKAGNKDYTIHGKFSKFSAFLNQAVSFGLINENPIVAANFKAPKGEPKAPFSLTMDEFLRFKALTNLTKHQQLVRDTYLTQVYCEGMRIGDVLKLKHSHIRENNIAYQAGENNKHKKQTITYILEPLREIIEGYKGQETNKILPWISEERETYLKEMNSKNTTINKTLKKLGKKANIENWNRLTTHTARHTYAMLLDHKNVPLTVIQQRLGHSDARTTSNYLKSLRKTNNEEVLKDLFE